jgi:hypothetical protein
MKNKIILIVVSVWIVFSLVYIAYDVWSDFKADKLAQAYQQGRVDTITSLITQAEASCDPISVSSQTKQISVINASCPPAAAK